MVTDAITREVEVSEFDTASATRVDGKMQTDPNGIRRHYVQIYFLDNDKHGNGVDHDHVDENSPYKDIRAAATINPDGTVGSVDISWIIPK